MPSRSFSIAKLFKVNAEIIKCVTNTQCIVRNVRLYILPPIKYKKMNKFQLEKTCTVCVKKVQINIMYAQLKHV